MHVERESHVISDTHIMNESESLDLSDTAANQTLSDSSDTSSEFDDELQVSYKPVSSVVMMMPV